MESKQKGSFAKGRFWRMCTRSGFCGSGNHGFLMPGQDCREDVLEELSVQGNSCQNHPFGNHPFGNPRNNGHGLVFSRLVRENSAAESQQATGANKYENRCSQNRHKTDSPKSANQAIKSKKSRKQPETGAKSENDQGGFSLFGGHCPPVAI